MHRCAVPRFTEGVGSWAAIDLFKRAGQRERIARELGARRIGKIFAAPRDHHRERLADERRKHEWRRPR